MASRRGRRRVEPDLGMLAARLLNAVEAEMFGELARRGFTDIRPRHGAVLAYLTTEGVRATELGRLSGAHKQVIGNLIDELESLGYVARVSDPSDRRAKLVVPTARGQAQMDAADEIITALDRRHSERMGASAFESFRAEFGAVVDAQRATADSLEEWGNAPSREPYPG